MTYPDDLAPHATTVQREEHHMIRPSATFLGLAVGIALGFGLVFGGFDGFVIIAVFGLVGLIAGRVADGELDLTEYLGGRRRRER